MSVNPAKPVTMVKAFAATDTGLVRRTNEDAFVIASLDGQRWRGKVPGDFGTHGLLLAVSDGMGGAKAGEVASALCVEIVTKHLLAAHRSQKPGETRGARAMLERAVSRASLRVHEAGKKPGRQGMGATLTAALVCGDKAFIAQVGDSRAYLLRGSELTRITRDQSYVQMLVDAGVMTTEEAERSPRRNIIMQVMGQRTIRPEMTDVPIQRGDRLVLCSDGLTVVVDDETLAEIAAPPTPLDLVCKNLVALTKDGGAPDNVTVVVADVV